MDSAQAPVYTVTSSAVSVLQYDLDTLVEKDTMPAIGSGNLLTAEFTENGQTTTYSGDSEEEDSGSLTYTLYLGSDSGDGTRYVQVQDSDLVYLVSSDVLNNLLGIGNSTEE